ncbi:glycine/betaine ABC transporter ATP-binding protein [filamentous cyanobacterium CCP5]|nr:glycine/betaine ABC transporter ATP-binding protein [filamentous cyanobacterium CCP5]
MINLRPKVRIENLVKIYGENPQHALHLFREGGNRDEILGATGNVLGVADVSLSINEGELFVIMGLSGSGKSTLVRCINRLIDPTSGHVYIDDEDIVKVSKERLREIRRTKISMVFQRFGLFPHKSVLDNVQYGLEVRGIDADVRRQKALDTLEVVGLRQWADYLPSALSGGMQQRVGLARALATDAPILLMDEAFGALDPLIRRGMQEELIRLQRDLQKTIIFISHDIQESLKIGDRVAIMKDGYMVQVGTPQEIVTNPADDYIREFTLDVNRAQVLTTGAIMRSEQQFSLQRGSARLALEDMQDLSRHHMFVITDGKPVGLLVRDELEAAVGRGVQDVHQVMITDFPRVQADMNLEQVFSIAQDGIPLAVVNDGGKFEGMIEPTDIFAGISAAPQNDRQASAAHRHATSQQLVS